MAGTVAVGMCRALLEVQRLDTVLDELAQQQASFPHKTKVAQIAQKAAEGNSLIVKLEEGINQIDTRIDEVADSIEQHQAKIAKDQREIDAGHVDYRQIEKLSADIAAHHDLIETMENEQLQLLETKESAKKRIIDYREKIIGLDNAKEKTMAAYRQQMAVLAAQTRQVTAARDEQRDKVDSDLLEHYDTLREQRGGIVVGRYDGQRCKACSLKLPMAIASDFSQPGDTGTCSECRRILIYLGEDDDE